ncbi:MAG: PQQ-binding-like beta-propeller repeat protein [Planctomycetaceae bacterium]
MPTEDYDEVDEYDDVEDAEVAEELREAEEKGRRQLARGAASRFSDRLTGGAERPGEEQIARSPFVVGLGISIGVLAIAALVFYVLIRYTSESRSLEAAQAALDGQSYQEADKKFEQFLVDFPNSSSAEVARIGLHKARVQQYTASSSLTPDGIHEGVAQLEQFVNVCRDFEAFREEKDNVRRYAEILARTGAVSAAKTKKRQPLDDSIAATAILNRFAPDGGIPKDTEDALTRLQRSAESEILKQTVLEGALADINAKIDSGNTIDALAARQALIDQYEVLNDDSDVQAVLTKILEGEQQLITREAAGRDAETTELPGSGLSSVSLTLRTQATVDQVSQGRMVFALGVDSCYGLDAETGEPRWKRVVGANAPFAPQTVAASVPGLLIYHTGSRELVMLSRQDGSVLWHQSMPDVPNGDPLIFQQQIYITTQGGRLWQISADSGRAVSVVNFTQPVIGPPALSSDERFLVIPGDQALVYTLSLSPLECVAVSYIPHRPGSVEAPVLTLGGLYLLCDNDTVDDCRLRVLAMDPQTSRLTVRAQDSVAGQVRDHCLLRGDKLFVPSSPQRVSAFRVTDDPDAAPLGRIGTNQIENAGISPMYLLAGPGGQLWLASQALRRFSVQTNALLLDNTEAVAEGLHLREMQFLDDSVFVTTSEPYSSSMFFTRVDRERMTGLWRTVIGANLVAVGPSSTSQSMLAVSDFGELFRIPLPELATGGFVLESTSNFRLPDKLEDPVGGLRLTDGRLAAYCGGAEPALWTFSGTGQLEQKWPLPAAPETQPASLAEGVVVALPGRLHMTARKGGSVQDYRASQTLNQQASWKSLVALGDTQVLAVNSENQFVKAEFRTSPPQLAEVSVTRMDHPVEVAPTPAGNLLVVATADGRLLLMQAGTLEVLGEADLQGVPSHSAFVAGNRIFVNVAGKGVKVYSLDPSLQQTGFLQTDSAYLAGTPVPDGAGGFVAARSDGIVAVLDADGNATAKTMSLGQAIQQGPLAIDPSLVVIAIDGSLYSIEGFLK